MTHWQAFGAGALAGFLLALGVFVSVLARASADHISPPILPGVPTSVMKAVEEKGYLTYALETGALNYPGFQAQARLVAEETAKVIGVPAYEVESDPDTWLTMPDDATFMRICGEGAAGCIQYWSNPSMIYFRRALLYNSQTGWLTAIGHEGLAGGHNFGLHERYNDRDFKCIPFPNPRTVMSCGSGIWIATEYDRDNVWQLMVPDRPNAVSLTVDGGWASVSWDLTRRDGGDRHFGSTALDNVTRVAFGWSENPSAPIEWVGSRGCGADYNYCNSSPGAKQRGFDSYWAGCIWLRAENAALWWVPQASAPNYWTLSGCFGIGGYDEFSRVVAPRFGGGAGDATCIAWFESTFNSQAVGGVGERGWFQIHPVHFPDPVAFNRMFDPVANTEFAKSLKDRQGWGPWSTAQRCGL